jgi:8-oxo-dGTP diphosphatase
MQKLAETNIVAGVVIKQDGKYLLVQENRPGTKVHGLWNFPAGKVEEGDSIENTAVREAKEEIGYDVELLRKLGIFQAHSSTPPKHAFEAKIVGGKLDWPKDEILEAKWFTLKEVRDMKDSLREEWIIGAISIMENNMENLEQRIQKIEERNQKVKSDKAWEISWTRRGLLAVFTYIAIGAYLQTIGVQSPWLNAVVPAGAFMLSTLTMPFFKKVWLKGKDKSLRGSQ